MLSGRGLCDELITRPEESYRLCCIVCDLETSRMGAPYIYDISRLKVKADFQLNSATLEENTVINTGLLFDLKKQWLLEFTGLSDEPK